MTERTYKRLADCEVCNATTFYQPTDAGIESSEWMSFEVAADPESVSGPVLKFADGEIEAPAFVDCPYRHEGES